MKILREPLLHFAVIAGALYLVYAVVNGRLAADAESSITFAEDDIALLAETWQRQWQRPPTEPELRGLMKSRLREEILYREALAVGLDDDDVVVRRRMVQKMELLTEDLALLGDPTDQELRVFYEEHRQDYALPPRVTLSHVFFNLDRRGLAGEEEAVRLLAELQAQSPPPAAASERGDAFLTGHSFLGVTPEEIERVFGRRFAATIRDMEPGWHGPIASAFGVHLVNIQEREPAREREFAEVRPLLVRDFERWRAERAKLALYEGLAARYSVKIDEDALSQHSIPAPDGSLE